MDSWELVRPGAPLAGHPTRARPQTLYPPSSQSKRICGFQAISYDILIERLPTDPEDSQRLTESGTTAASRRQPSPTHMAIDPRSNRRADRDWYSISVESIRRTLTLLLVVIGAIGGAFAYQQWETRTKTERAQKRLGDAGSLARQIEDRSDYRQVRKEFFSAWENLDAGRQAFEEERFGEALDLADQSFRELRTILDRKQGKLEEQGTFLHVQGNVEYRRGERGAWKRAGEKDILNPGDWVKTSAGASASVRFADGSEYTLRANTMVHLSSQVNRFGRNEQVAEMAFGWVELSTETNTGRVKTPKSEAQVRSSSEAMVSFDRDRNESLLAVYEGGMEVTSENGQSQTLGALQQVTQIGDLLSAPSSLPGKPRLALPPNDRAFDLSSQEVRLSWRGVPGAGSYALQVSRNRLFANLIIDDTDRTKTSARLGLRGEGAFYWQVAAVGADGTRGPWSQPRSFQVTKSQRSTGDDKTAPALRIESVHSYGRMLIISGRTESGAILSLNGQEAEVNPDGTFNERLQVDEEGFVFVTAVATDAAGNSGQEQRRVFVDSAY